MLMRSLVYILMMLIGGLIGFTVAERPIVVNQIASEDETERPPATSKEEVVEEKRPVLSEGAGQQKEQVEVPVVDRQPEVAEKVEKAPLNLFQKLRERDPEKYAKIIARIEQNRQKRHQAALSKLDFLKEIGTDEMSDSAKKQHLQFQALVISQEEIEEKLSQPELSMEERKELMGQMREVKRNIEEASLLERQELLRLGANWAGCTGEDVTYMVDLALEIFSATSP